MKNLFLFLVFLFPVLCFGQFGVAYQQSRASMIGINYEFFNRLRPELRFGMDNRYSEWATLEFDLMFDYVQKDDYELYAGVGVIASQFVGYTLPLGVNFYPFENKKFGFSIEAMPIRGRYYGLLSWDARFSGGFRYRFSKD